MGKTDTCQDIKHKKRGRPKLRDKRSCGSDTNVENKYEVMYGTIQTPTLSAASSAKHEYQQSISFIHEPIESFQEPNTADQKPTAGRTLTPVRLSATPQITRPPPLALQPATLPIQPYPAVAPYKAPLPLHSYIHVQQQQQQPPPPPPPPPPLSTSEQIKVISPMEPLPASSRSSPKGENDDRRMITLFLSMEVCCARISDEVTDLWGYYPQEIAHRSLYDFVSSKDSNRLSTLHRLLLDNVLDVAKRSDPSYEVSQPPPTERSTSDLFHSTDPAQLATVANGSSRFSDTLHIKKRSGEPELFEIVVYMGAGLGADLFVTSSLSRLYIVAEFKKYRYEVSAKTPFDNAHAPWTMSKFSQIANPTSRKLLPLSKPSQLSPRPIADARNTSHPWSSIGPRHVTAPHDLRQYSLPTHFTVNSHLNTVSFAKKAEIPKINVAPTTSQAGRRISEQVYQSVLTPAIPILNSVPNGVNRQGSSNPYSTLAYRFAPSTTVSNTTGIPHGGLSVTHPTQQYFLQTSSSTLNAAASAAQVNSRGSNNRPDSRPTDDTAAGNDRATGKTESNRKVEMSIRSLLC
ncbi:hypothetical protein DFQ28_007403 [Apophysomyces sp. BC1034]|nr:hypothetical protein DFQ30_007312 [Apophysomyces sp. BC1015]KAG0176294.1 hypothetical protein DFQ29_006315 [Apophysomyces sp. BC1021]KAG0186711.1 hypothetical protein DFQ28_007403 [Apophysomyces sp. BC1034]